METLAHVLEKIARLRRLASSANRHEAEAAAAAAARLAEKYRVSEAELGAVGRDAVPGEDTEPVIVRPSMPAWLARLVGLLALHHGCLAIRERRLEGEAFVLFGRPADVDLARSMIGWLAVEVEQQCLRVGGAHRSARWRESWCYGLVVGIGRQLYAVRVETIETASSVALARLDRRIEDAEAALRAAQPSTQLARRQVVGVHHAALAAGVERGRALHLGRSLAAEESPPLEAAE